MKPNVKIYRNNDQAIIVWNYESVIENCIGFAVFRQLNNESPDLAEPLKNRVGFADEPFVKGQQKPSTEWPIQRFLWTDYSLQVGDKAKYKIVPILLNSGELVKDNENSSDWSEEIEAVTGDKYQAFFNRGIVSSQFYSRNIADVSSDVHNKTLKAVLEDDNKLRRILGGYLATKLFSLLEEIRGNTALTVFGALYELHQEDLIEKLKEIKDRANIILANGAAKGSSEDKNADSRAEIKDAGVNVHDRIVGTGHFAHNKFLVICENNIPKRVWSGSTNWTPGGMFTQLNNGLLIEDQDVAQKYLDEWHKLEAAGSGYPDDLFDFNAESRTSGDDIKIWFNPTAEQGDLNDVKELMDAAKDGILFLMFNPGPKGTLFNKILELQQQKPDLMIHGIANQDPGGKEPLIFFNNGAKDTANWSTLLPKRIEKEFAFWFAEKSGGLVNIHSKVLVIDPFSEKPYVVTGSNNLGPKASGKNDENLLIIQNKKLAEEYAVHITGAYQHYRWRYSLFNKHSDFKGLTKDTNWMTTYLTDNTKKELEFWLGSKGD